MVNVALGMFLIFGGYTSLFWVYIGYCAFDLTSFVILIFIFTLTSCFSKDPGKIISLSNFSIKSSLLTNLDRKKLAPSLTKSLITSPDEEPVEFELSSVAVTEKKLVDEDPPDVTKEDMKPKKEPSKDSSIRWTSLVVYLVVSTPLIVAMVALVATLK